MGTIPLWLGLIANSLLLYAIQTPLHEACHGNIAGRDSRWMWLNHLVGFLCGALLLHEYKAFRHMHLMHHRDTNDPEMDPDNWVDVKRPLNVLVRCLTIVPYYHHFFFKHVVLKPETPGNFKVATHVIAVYWGLYSIAFWLIVFGYWREVLMLWLLPHWLGSAIIIFFFAWLPHQPHVAKERYRDTNVFWIDGALAKVVDWLYLFQNFHLIHHLFPRIPFFKYRKVFTELRPVLEKQGARIYELGH
jgi:beta-carotene hydroxylase